MTDMSMTASTKASSDHFHLQSLRSFFSRDNWTIRMSPIEGDRDRDRDLDRGLDRVRERERDERRERERERDELESTGAFYRRRYDDISPSAPPPRRVEIPFGVIVTLVLYLIGQLVGSVWWAATLQSDVRYAQREDAKIWQKVETHDLQLGKLDTIVRNAVKEAMSDAGIRNRSLREE
jgi:hypothetical protein